MKNKEESKEKLLGLLEDLDDEETVLMEYVKKIYHLIDRIDSFMYIFTVLFILLCVVLIAG